MEEVAFLLYRTSWTEGVPEIFSQNKNSNLNNYNFKKFIKPPISKEKFPDFSRYDHQSNIKKNYSYLLKQKHSKNSRHLT